MSDPNELQDIIHQIVSERDRLSTRVAELEGRLRDATALAKQTLHVSRSPAGREVADLHRRIDAVASAIKVKRDGEGGAQVHKGAD